MSTVLLALIAIVILAGLVATFMTIKTWHWAQMLLLLGVFLMGLSAMFLSAETLRIHRALRSKLPNLRTQITAAEDMNAALRSGTNNAGMISRILSGEQESPLGVDRESIPGLPELSQEVKLWTRQRGRVWRNVKPAGKLNQKGEIDVEIPSPSPHGMPEGAIVYVFESGPADGQNPQEGAQYLGQFQVAAVSAQGATLAPVQRLDPRTGNRLANSRGPWSIYETMPSDRHEVFANQTDEQLRKLLPEQSVEEYLRQGGPATADDDQYHSADYDEQGRRLYTDDRGDLVGPDGPAKSAERRYDRPLRAYAYLFDQLYSERVVMQTQQLALKEDIALMEQANKSALKLTEYREAEKTDLAEDLKLMIRDRKTIVDLAKQLADMVENARQLLIDALDANQQLADQLMQRQLGRIQVTAPRNAS